MVTWPEWMFVTVNILLLTQRITENAFWLPAFETTVSRLKSRERVNETKFNGWPKSHDLTLSKGRWTYVEHYQKFILTKLYTVKQTLACLLKLLPHAKYQIPLKLESMPESLFDLLFSMLNFIHSISFSLFYLTQLTFEPPHDKTNKLACAPSEDSDQPGYSPSLIRVFAVHSVGS